MKNIVYAALILANSSNSAISPQQIKDDFQRWENPTKAVSILKQMLMIQANPEIITPLYCPAYPHIENFSLNTLEVLEQTSLVDKDQREAIWFKVRMHMASADKHCHPVYYVKYAKDKGISFDGRMPQDDTQPRWMPVDIRYGPQQQWLFKSNAVLDEATLRAVTENLSFRVKNAVKSRNNQKPFAITSETHNGATTLTLTLSESARYPKDLVQQLTKLSQLKMKYKNNKGEWVDSGIAHSSLKDVRANVMTDGRWVIAFEYNPKGREQFAKLTTANVNKPLGIFIDDQLISAPKVNAPITGGSGIIEGNFTAKEAVNLANLLSTKPYPVPLILVEKRELPLPQSITELLKQEGL